MTLIDTNVLVALVDERDRLHTRARRDLRRVKGPFGVTSAVLVEASFLLEAPCLRGRLLLLLERLRAEPSELDPPWWPEVFAFLDTYRDQAPDRCDAILVTLAARNGSKLWSYDSEFEETWRLPNGRRVALVSLR